MARISYKLMGMDQAGFVDPLSF